MNKLLFIALAGAAILCGQSDAVSLPRPVPEFDRIQQYLVLTPDQLQRLKQILQTRQEADQLIWNQIFEKQNQLNRLLEGGSTDALAVGRLMVEVRDLQKQVPGSGEKYMREALGILNETQKAKLPALADALQLAPAAHQAVHLHLLAAPAPDVHILPMPAERSATLPAVLSSSVGN